MDPADAVLKGKPHAFESWSAHLSFSIAFNFLLAPSDVAALEGGIHSTGSIKPLIPAALFP
jgi:hypothetical protein